MWGGGCWGRAGWEEGEEEEDGGVEGKGRLVGVRCGDSYCKVGEDERLSARTQRNFDLPSGGRYPS